MGQWPRAPWPATATSHYDDDDDDDSFFRSRQCAEGRAFCNQEGHRRRVRSLWPRYDSRRADSPA